MRMTITLTGVFDAPHRNPDGSWDIDIPCVEIDPHQNEVLRNLFPDLESAVGKLLAKQALLNSIR